MKAMLATSDTISKHQHSDQMKFFDDLVISVNGLSEILKHNEAFVKPIQNAIQTLH